MHSKLFEILKLTLVLLNSDKACLSNSVDPDQLASEEEANWSGSALFVKLDQVIWLAENWR